MTAWSPRLSAQTHLGHAGARAGEHIPPGLCPVLAPRLLARHVPIPQLQCLITFQNCRAAPLSHAQWHLAAASGQWGSGSAHAPQAVNNGHLPSRRPPGPRRSANWHGAACSAHCTASVPAAARHAVLLLFLSMNLSSSAASAGGKSCWAPAGAAAASEGTSDWEPRSPKCHGALTAVAPPSRCHWHAGGIAIPLSGMCITAIPGRVCHWHVCTLALS